MYTRKNLYTAAMLLCASVCFPFFFIKKGVEIADYASVFHFVAIEMGMALFALDRFLETKQPFNILLFVAFGTISVVDLLNKFFDKSVDNYYPVAIIAITAIICSLILLISWLRPQHRH